MESDRKRKKNNTISLKTILDIHILLSMNRRGVFLFFFMASFFMMPGVVIAQSGSAGEIRLTTDVNDGIQFEVYDIQVTGMKDRQIYYGFCLSQGNEWVKGTWLETDSFSVPYSPCYWNGKAAWFTYTYELLEKSSDIDKSYTGTFFIVNSVTNDTISTKDIPFHIAYDSHDSDTMQSPAQDDMYYHYEDDESYDRHDESYDNDDNYDYESGDDSYESSYDDTYEEPDSGSGEKSMMDYFAEAENRLVSFGGSGSLKKDSRITGEWMSVLIGDRRSYSVLIFYMQLKSDGTGVWEKNPFYLMTDGSLQFNKDEYAIYNITWGVEIYYTEWNEPVTLLRITFSIDGSYLRMYYAYTESNAIVTVFYNETSQTASDSRTAWRTKDVFLADWEANKGGLADALYKLYKADKMYDEVQFNNMILEEMGSHYAFTNLLNSF